MTSGHGGCGPYGLALSAWRRGFDVELVLNDDRALFLDSVRSEEKKEVLRLVQEEMQKEIVETDIRVSYRGFAAGELTELVESGAIPVVLISSYRIYREKFPHWVVVAGSDERFFYVPQNPLVETAKQHQRYGSRQHAYPQEGLRAHGPLRQGTAQGHGRPTLPAGSTLNVVSSDYRRQILLLQIRPNRPRSFSRPRITSPGPNWSARAIPRSSTSAGLTAIWERAITAPCWRKRALTK